MLMKKMNFLKQVSHLYHKCVFLYVGYKITTQMLQYQTYNFHEE